MLMDGAIATVLSRLNGSFDIITTHGGGRRPNVHHSAYVLYITPDNH